MTATDNARLARFIWETRYRDPDARPAERSIEDTWRRVAHAVAAIEEDPRASSERFLGLLRGYRFLPGGRILAGSGTARRVTLFNCFVMGAIEDSMEGIFQALKEGALTMQLGGGIGYDFSTLRPRGSRARTTGTTASGPVSFLRVWDAMCDTVLSTGARRGAMMATLRCDHPDILEFIDAKRMAGALPRFNLSVLVSDAFMRALAENREWALVFPEGALAEPATGQPRSVLRAWSGSTEEVPCRVHAVLAARELWERIAQAAHASAEPGVLFIDRINAANNLGYCESLSATNPCGEEPLPAYGACNLGSINLASCVLDPFAANARLDLAAIRDSARLAVRFLDNVIDISRFPLEQQRAEVQRSRRIGLGITGLADALAMLGRRYGDAAARASAALAMTTLRDAAYEASVALARERGAFPAFDRAAYCERPFIRTLPAQLQADIRRHGIRNSHLTAIAPTGTISLLAGNVSSGIEPIFALEGTRRVLQTDGTQRDFQTTDFAYAMWHARPATAAELDGMFSTGDSVSAEDQLLMQAALQPAVDSAISKTIVVPANCTASDVREILVSAFALGLKGCTVFRTGTRTPIIKERDAELSRELAAGAHCCEAGFAADSAD
jgi:ribonucleoside-diphosphate reductase alpha chain